MWSSLLVHNNSDAIELVAFWLKPQYEGSFWGGFRNIQSFGKKRQQIQTCRTELWSSLLSSQAESLEAHEFESREESVRLSLGLAPYPDSEKVDQGLALH